MQVRGRSRVGDGPGQPPFDLAALHTTAWLLVGSGTAATDLLVRALSRRPRTRAEAVRVLVRVHLGRWTRLAHGTGSIDASPPADAWWVSPAELADARRLDLALHALPAAGRTALVLTAHEGLGPDAVAALVPGAAELLHRAHAELAGEVPDPADLPARLDGLAAALSGDRVDLDVLDRGVLAVRSRRRRRWATAAVAAAALVVGTALVPGDMTGRADDPPTAARPTTPPTSTAPTTVWLDVTTGFPVLPQAEGLLALPTRGSLAGDQAYLDELLTAASPVLTGSVVDGRRVVFAGDVGDRRLALVTGQDPYGVTQAWFWGPAGAAVADLKATGSGGGATTESWATVLGSPGVFVALVMPGDVVEVSVGIVVDDAGIAGREWRHLESPDGVLTAPADGRTGSVHYRVLRGGQQVEVGEAWNWSLGYVLLGATTETPPVPLRRGAGHDPVDPDAFAAAVAEVLWPTGWTREDLHLSVLWSGDLPTLDGPPADVVVIAAVLPNGAVVTTTAWSITGDGFGASGGCGSAGHPAGTDLAALTVVARCDVWGGNGDDQLTSLVVTAPKGTRSVALGADDGLPAVPMPLEHGWAVVREADPGLSRVTAPGPGTVTHAGPGDFWDV